MVACAISFRKFGVSRAINIGKCYLLNMDKIRRTSSDEATSSIIDELLADRGFGNREFDRATHGAITYSRIRDIRSGLRGPIRLSEFLIICQTCDVDPVVTLREIITEAHRLEEEQTRERESRITDDLVDRIAAHPEDYDVAANRDPNARLEAETPDE
nr:MAG TPA: hypothetical protein [Caudoviricetes sp.]